MKKVCFHTHSNNEKNNLIFKTDQPNPVNSDNRLNFFKLLKDKLAKVGYDLSTQDINTPTSSHFTIYQTVPENLSEIYPEKSYLLLLDSQTVDPRSWKIKYHNFFKRIFTFKNFNNSKYIEMFHSYTFSKPILTNPKMNNKIVMVCSNKRSTSKNQLYIKRYELIKFLLKNYENNFDLYGSGWAQPPIYVDKRNNVNFRKLIDFVNKKIFLKNKVFINSNSYKGIINNKNLLLRDYDFNICIENTHENNFITSIIFESMQNSAIPIYLGAPNITDYVPNNIFIDLRNFNNLRDLMKYIFSINEKKILEIKNNMYIYLQENKHYKFTSNYSVNKIIQNISL